MARKDNKTFFYERLATEKEWDSFANRYETDRRLKLIFDRLIEPEELKDRLFLDAGSGGGHFSQQAERLGAEVFSFDIGLNLLRQISEKCSSKKVVGSVLDIPFKQERFDVVLCTEVIEHTPHPLYAVKCLSTVVKPGGLLIITVPCRLWNPIVELATFLKLRLYEGHENFIWPWKLKNDLEKEGFKIESLIGFNFCPIFHRKLEPLFNFFDRLYGQKLPWLMVNIAVRARKEIKDSLKQ